MRGIATGEEVNVRLQFHPVKIDQSHPACLNQLHLTSWNQLLFTNGDQSHTLPNLQSLLVKIP